MLIDWFTVGSQLINFIILLVLLKYFLYGRIIRAMDEREEKIRSRLEEAEDKKNEAEEEVRKYQKKNDELENKRNEILSQAKAEAEKQKKTLFREIRVESDSRRKRWLESIENEKQAFLTDLRQMFSQHVYAVAKKTVRDLTDEALEKKIVSAFAKQIRTADEDQMKTLADSLKKSNADLRVFSGFEMSSNYREKIAKSIHDKMGADIGIEFETSSRMGLDLELRTEGHRFSWGAQDYLDRLEQAVQQTLEDEVQQKEGHPDTRDH